MKKSLKTDSRSEAMPYYCVTVFRYRFEMTYSSLNIKRHNNPFECFKGCIIHPLYELMMFEGILFKIFLVFVSEALVVRLYVTKISVNTQ